ncbi:MAG TPA: beta-ketoacyl-[acyl-carrier-protein] synthase family protein, partial [Longimicrobium sp.]|nr:beta-ketoacyl-[acyl-carrier-protein] synthase family protein [Longimicrobium sp.]
TLSTACASSTSALGYAYELLQQGQADVVLAGGADAFSLPTYAGFYALGAMAKQACSPFSEGIGVTFGEGAGFVVLERLEEAEARGAKVEGALLGFGGTGDAHHITAPHPTGEGLRRAMELALAEAGLRPTDIDYVNAHGTGTRDNDTAETAAIKQLFHGGAVPPISSSKSGLGHTLGAAGILEFVVSLLGQREGLIPPTVNFTGPRPGCDLDYVPNQARPGRIRHFVSNSAAFGGVNAVVVGGEVEPHRALPPRHPDDVVITGLGVVSPLGCTVDAFADALREGRTAIVPAPQLELPDGSRGTAALMRGFEPRRLLPTADVRRLERLDAYAVVASGLALRDAGLEGKVPETRTGAVVGLTRGAVVAHERFLQNLRKDGIRQLSPRYFPSMVLSTVSGQLSQAFRVRGIVSTVVDGTTSGLHALLHGFRLLRDNGALDAVVVVAADELGAMLHGVYARAGLLGAEGRSRPYDPEASGMVLGEGAAAIVLERRSAALARGARVRARLEGCGQTADGLGSMRLQPEGHALELAARLALQEAGVTAADVGFVYGHGRGQPAYDGREARAVVRLVGCVTPVGCVMGNTGVVESASGLLSVLAAVLGLERGEVYPIVSDGRLPEGVGFVHERARPGAYARALVIGGTESGNNAAVVLGKEES